MGYSRKEEIAKLRRERKEAKASKKRKENVREGRATVALVERTLEIKTELERKNAMSFDRVWVVFDKDDL